MKVCFKCGQEKPLSEFYKNKRMADGHFNKCKECAKTDVSNNRKANHQHYLEYERDRAMNPDRIEARKAYLKTENGKIVKALTEKNYRMKHPEKAIAHYVLSNAVRDGKLKRKPCEICGSIVKVEGHHPDYSKPLCVVWLCEKHHKEVHRKMRLQKRLTLTDASEP